MCRLSWFLDPGGWGKSAAVGLYFIFPGICTLSLFFNGIFHFLFKGLYHLLKAIFSDGFCFFCVGILKAKLIILIFNEAFLQSGSSLMPLKTSLPYLLLCPTTFNQSDLLLMYTNTKLPLQLLVEIELVARNQEYKLPEITNKLPDGNFQEKNGKKKILTIDK
ncbi:hypothetical protein STEG23_012957, partial [Scotinomys teguina]